MLPLAHPFYIPPILSICLPGSRDPIARVSSIILFYRDEAQRDALVYPIARNCSRITHASRPRSTPLCLITTGGNEGCVDVTLSISTLTADTTNLFVIKLYRRYSNLDFIFQWYCKSALLIFIVVIYVPVRYWRSQVSALWFRYIFFIADIEAYIEVRMTALVVFVTLQLSSGYITARFQSRQR